MISTTRSLQKWDLIHYVACGVTISTSPCGGDGEGLTPFKQPTDSLIEYNLYEQIRSSSRDGIQFTHAQSSRSRGRKTSKEDHVGTTHGRPTEKQLRRPRSLLDRTPPHLKDFSLRTFLSILFSLSFSLYPFLSPSSLQIHSQD